ncbi:CD276 antigen isoform X2 [Plectropomus leopardus]|uniref:CD276 antigen isoform X2 n=1 Tax=Plectropomus leopardus TaxID=160734 RepID=UPI001C4B3662|nr:CD276 antigen isoform X2 [Plectropomus leopardus]
MLSLLLSVMLAMQAMAVMEVYVPEQPVVAQHGMEATLNCSFSHNNPFNLSDMSVFWQLTDTKRSVHGYSGGHDKLVDQVERFANRTSLFPTQLGLGNASLLLRRVVVADEGSYTCFVRVQDYGSAALLLLVAAPYSKPVVTLEPESNLRPGDEVALHCVAYDGYPEASVIWQDGSGRNLTDNITTSLVANEEGLFTMTSVLTVLLEPNSTYSCRLINPLLGDEGYAFVTITENTCRACMLFITVAWIILTPGSNHKLVLPVAEQCHRRVLGVNASLKDN